MNTNELKEVAQYIKIELDTRSSDPHKEVKALRKALTSVSEMIGYPIGGPSLNPTPGTKAFTVGSEYLTKDGNYLFKIHLDSLEGEKPIAAYCTKALGPFYDVGNLVLFTKKGNQSIVFDLKNINTWHSLVMPA